MGLETFLAKMGVRNYGRELTPEPVAFGLEQIAYPEIIDSAHEQKAADSAKQRKQHLAVCTALAMGPNVFFGLGNGPPQ